jgi:hypothetical protein
MGKTPSPGLTATLSPATGARALNSSPHIHDSICTGLPALYASA